jgi:aspartate-semialdehyde dehydrogenase
MTRLAIVHPTTLLGKELRERLDESPDWWDDLSLLTSDDEELGTLTEVRGAAAVVVRADAEALEGVDLAFFCGPMARNRPLLESLPSETTAVVLSPDATRGDGLPVVAGVNLEDASPGQVLVSPHPGAVAVAELLHPLVALGLESAVATLVQPASMLEEPALHELFEQTRKALNFARPEPGIFGHQLAFNLLPNAGDPDSVVALAGAILGDELDLAVQIVQGGVFHGFAISLYLRLARDPGAEALRAVLKKAPHVELARKPGHLGPLDAAAHAGIQVGRIHPDPRHPGSYWLWAAMDNLTRGGALNAIEIAQAALG